jgi:hypothetical protein
VKPAFPLALLAALLLAGCASFQEYLTPRLAPAVIGSGLHLPIRHFSARVYMEFLELDVRAERADADFMGNLDLELECAAKICAALAQNGAMFEYEWQILELKMSSQFGSFLKWHGTVSYVTLQMDRATLRSLRERNAPPSAYPQYWHFVYGSKVVPLDSKTWKEWWPADFERKPVPKTPPDSR